jgi:hypothetical protein
VPEATATECAPRAASDSGGEATAASCEGAALAAVDICVDRWLRTRLLLLCLDRLEADPRVERVPLRLSALGAPGRRYAKVPMDAETEALAAAGDRVKGRKVAVGGCGCVGGRGDTGETGESEDEDARSGAALDVERERWSCGMLEEDAEVAMEAEDAEERWEVDMGRDRGWGDTGGDGSGGKMGKACAWACEGLAVTDWEPETVTDSEGAGTSAAAAWLLAIDRDDSEGQRSPESAGAS